MTDRFEIRVASTDDLAIMTDWAAAEGWNPGLNDASCYRLADPGGFLIGCLDALPVAAISAIRYRADFGFIGFYIVKPAFRGRGYGMQIWNAALDHLKGRNIGLDGVPEQQENYVKSGFALAYRNIRFAGSSEVFAGHGPDIRPLRDVPEGQLLAYEAAFFPAARNSFTRAWIAQPGATALGAFSDGRLVGYGVVRPCRNGYKIAPLSADSETIATALFRALVSGLPAGEAVYLDVPEVNQPAVALARAHNMVPAFETARMYTGPTPRLPLARSFGITSFEIG